MKKKLLVLKSFFKDDLFVRNKAAAYARNKKILNTTIVGSLCCYVILFIASFLSQSYMPARRSYIIGIVILFLIRIFIRFMSDKIATVFIYFIHFFFIAYCTYNSAIVWPNDICVMILAEIFIVSTLVLDKSWHVIGCNILSCVAYIMVISKFKAPYHFVDETVNIICFSLLSCIVGVFTRKALLENFESVETLRISQLHYELAIKHSSGVMCEFDVAKKCVAMTKDVAAIFETPQKVYGVPYEPVKNGAIKDGSIKDYINFYEGIIAGSKTGTAEFETLTANGWRWQKASYSTIFDNSNKPVSAVISFIDITEQRKEQNRLKKEAKTDGMTGVYNRATAETLINQILKSKSEPFAFLIADVDNLKNINDTLGHFEGDKAIKSLANILKSRSRNDDVVGRIGGDEFIAFISGIETRNQIEDKVGRLMGSLCEINIGDNMDYPLSASIGIVLDAPGNKTFNDLYLKADKALYAAKRGGKNQFAFYDE